MSVGDRALNIRIRGIVQGVGFRPYIYGLAGRFNLTGWVRNTSSGVEIEINGCPEAIDAFLGGLKIIPPLARIDEILTRPSIPDSFSSFQILESLPHPGDFIPISPDVSICKDCQMELFNPGDRRFRYPFINCTNCGPRFTIIRDIPYDRPFTTMSNFPLCDSCRDEYENPHDRRFHAQPVACPDCGPQIWFMNEGRRLAEKEDALQLARDWIKAGKIIAIKGLGGFHLACDACNPQAVTRLRDRKKRSDKPFALMSYNLDAISKYCIIQPEEKELLLSHQKPIVLLEKQTDALIVAEVAPSQNLLGFMLPYTPLHLLIMEPEMNFPDVLVMTSGNLSEEPIAFKDEDALSRLAGLADGFLTHNRPIHIRVDDSVVRAVSSKSYVMRRSRGYAPDGIRLSTQLPGIMATGSELKNTFCLTRENYAFMSHHIGDMENYETLESFESGIDHFEKLFRIKPEMIACDLHPNYLATRYAIQRSQTDNIPLIKVQHHHAHLASCLADNDWNSIEPVIGLTYDGVGYGLDGKIWGGECLFGGFLGFERLFYLSEVIMPGGDMATRISARMALAHLWHAGIEWNECLPPVLALNSQEKIVLKNQIEKRLNSPLTSSMGRFFDAAASLIGIRQVATYEGQAAIELENIASPHENGFYECEIIDGIINPAPLWENLVNDWKNRVSNDIISARFHNSIVELSFAICNKIQDRTGCHVVALSGGVWQNKFLLERTMSKLIGSGFRVLTHRQVPTNDGGIALGQALVAAYSKNL